VNQASKPKGATAKNEHLLPQLRRNRWQLDCCDAPWREVDPLYCAFDHDRRLASIGVHDAWARQVQHRDDGL
jgi:hypothetical protein